MRNFEERDRRESLSPSERGIKSAGDKKNWHTPGYYTLSHKQADKTFRSGLCCLTVSDSRCQQKTGVLSFTLSKDWVQSDPISFPLPLDFSTIEHIYHFYLASTFWRTVTKCFTEEEMNTINKNNSESKELCKRGKKYKNETI